MSGTAEPLRVAIWGLDNFSRKNRAQLTRLNGMGYRFDVFTNDSLGDSAENLPPGNSLYRLERRAAARVRQLAAYLRANRNRLNHVEVYPGGRFAAAYALIARIFRVPMMVVERGDLLYQARYDAITRLSMRLCFRTADLVWCREFYQERAARQLTDTRVFLLPNAVGLPTETTDPTGRSTDFLWVNRLIVERKARWVTDLLALPEFANARAEMVGFLEPGLGDAATRDQQAYVEANKPSNLRIGGYTEPGDLYRRARFFLLPSDIVFCNNALLEAMSHGVVPLVSDVEGSRLIVSDGVDGFVFPHSRDGLRDAMRRALRLTPAQYGEMSNAVVEKVRAAFSLERWAETLAGEYRGLARSAGNPSSLRP